MTTEISESEKKPISPQKKARRNLFLRIRSAASHKSRYAKDPWFFVPKGPDYGFWQFYPTRVSRRFSIQMVYDEKREFAKDRRNAAAYKSAHKFLQSLWHDIEMQLNNIPELMKFILKNPSLHVPTLASHIYLMNQLFGRDFIEEAKKNPNILHRIQNIPEFGSHRIRLQYLKSLITNWSSKNALEKCFAHIDPVFYSHVAFHPQDISLLRHWKFRHASSASHLGLIDNFKHYHLNKKLLSKFPSKYIEDVIQSTQLHNDIALTIPGLTNLFYPFFKLHEEVSALESSESNLPLLRKLHKQSMRLTKNYTTVGYTFLAKYYASLESSKFSPEFSSRMSDYTSFVNNIQNMGASISIPNVRYLNPTEWKSEGSIMQHCLSPSIMPQHYLAFHIGLPDVSGITLGMLISYKNNSSICYANLYQVYGYKNRSPSKEEQELANRVLSEFRQKLGESYPFVSRPTESYEGVNHLKLLATAEQFDKSWWTPLCVTQYQEAVEFFKALPQDVFDECISLSRQYKDPFERLMSTHVSRFVDTNPIPEPV